MAIVLYNTAAREKQRFEPIERERVRVYVCGPTVYDYAHIGNARPVVVFDVLYRLLRREYGPGHVTYVRNITDLDDKIIAAARESGKAIEEITSRTTAAFHEDVAALGALPPDAEPRATEYIPQMIALVERLIARGHAYEAKDHVLFHVPSAAGYGGLSGCKREEQIAGARVEVAPYKKDPADFVLWKPSTPELPGWDSPWGRGRPGWHLECSAMSEARLGLPFDIHGGGLDLLFPHHENEVAQSTSAHGGEFARYWMHNGFVTVEGEKMAKSEGNILLVRELLDEYSNRQIGGEIIRLALLAAHYRQPLNWTQDGVRQARKRLDGLYIALRNLEDVEVRSPADDAPDDLTAVLEDDLNTPKALAVLDGLATAANKAEDAAEKAGLKSSLIAGGDLLGLLQVPVRDWIFAQSSEVSVSEDIIVVKDSEQGISEQGINDRIAERAEARKAQDFAKADRIRDELAKQGIILEDRPGGKTDWRRAG